MACKQCSATVVQLLKGRGGCGDCEDSGWWGERKPVPLSDIVRGQCPRTLHIAGRDIITIKTMSYEHKEPGMPLALAFPRTLITTMAEDVALLTRVDPDGSGSETCRCQRSEGAVRARADA